MTTTWHAPPDTLARFAREPEALDEVTASSVEQHLIGCAECRAAVADATDPAVLQHSWAEVVDGIDQPRPSVFELLLRRLHVSDDVARIVGATPGLRGAWLVTVALLGWGAITIAADAGTDAFFLAIAPLVPLGAVLVAFLPAEEPGGEAAAATPMYGAGVVLRRSLAVLAPTFTILTAVGLLQRDPTGAGAHWLLPAIALTLTSLVLSTYVRATTATATSAAVWIIVLVLAKADAAPRHVALGQSALYSAGAQLVALAIALAAAAALYLRRDRFSTMEVTW
jgi:hypothetical protein